MQATNLEHLEDIDRPDVVALDNDGKIVFIAEVQGFPFDSNPKKTKQNAILQITDYLQASTSLIPFAMLVDSESISVFQWDGSNLSEVINFNTSDVLSHYEPEFNKKQIFHLYLTGLTEAWISDFCYHWKSEIPPAYKEISEIGLLRLLQGGITQP